LTDNLVPNKKNNNNMIESIVNNDRRVNNK